MSVGAILGAFGTMRAGRRVGRGVEAGSALLAQAAIQSGDLVGRHIASAIIQVADSADAIANGLTASFERTVAAALVNVHGDVRMTLDEMERISAGWKTLVESEMQKFRMTLLTSFGLLVVAIALLAPLVHNELAGNSAWISKTMHFVYECKFALLCVAIACYFVLPRIANLVYFMHLMQFVNFQPKQHHDVGCVSAFVGDLPAPTGYLLCDGSNVSRTTFALLFSVIGTKYGNGDGRTTFTLPDLRGTFLRGVDSGRNCDPDVSTRTARADGATGAAFSGTTQNHAFQVHGHSFNSNFDSAPSPGNHGTDAGAHGGVRPYTSTTKVVNPLPLEGVTLRTSTETRPMNTAVHWIVRADTL